MTFRPTPRYYVVITSSAYLLLRGRHSEAELFEPAPFPNSVPHRNTPYSTIRAQDAILPYSVVLANICTMLGLAGKTQQDAQRSWLVIQSSSAVSCLPCYLIRFRSRPLPTFVFSTRSTLLTDRLTTFTHPTDLGNHLRS